MLIFLGIVCLLSVPYGNCARFGKRDDSKTTEANDYLDDVIAKTIEENRHKLEPYRPGNLDFDFQHKVLLVTFKREVHLENMTITGLTTVHREGDCQRSNKDGVSKLSASLGMGVIEFESKAKLKLLRKFTMSGEIGYVTIHLEVIRDNNAGTPPKVEKLEIYDQKGTDVRVSDLGPFNKLAELIIKAAKRMFSAKLNRQFEEKLKECLDEKFKESVFPID